MQTAAKTSSTASGTRGCGLRRRLEVGQRVVAMGLHAWLRFGAVGGYQLRTQVRTAAAIFGASTRASASSVGA